MTTSYKIGAYQATSGFMSDDGRLSDGVTATGSGWEATGGSSAGSTAAVTALIDLGDSPASVTQVQFTVAWEGTPSVVLEYSNFMASWTTVQSITTPNGNGTFGGHSYTVTISPSITARYWRLSVQDTTTGGGGTVVGG